MQTGPESPSSQAVIDVGEREFERDVVERSRAVPVVVDFWAPWCGPCRTLGPLLEQLAEEHAGAFVLARVNSDENPQLAGQFGVRSIPAVVAIRDGAIVAEFVGAQPLSFLRRFIAALLPSPAELRARAGREHLAAGDGAAAEAEFRAALLENPNCADALVGLAEVEAGRGERDAALARLERVVADGEVARRAEQLAAELRTRSAEGEGLSEPVLRGRLAADAGDLEARLELGRLLAAAGRYEEALEQLLQVVRADPKFADEGARKAMLDVFALLGPREPLCERFRSELAKALFR